MSMVMGNFLAGFGTILALSVSLTYVAECFREHTVEVEISLATSR
jgi:hypothetical protein